MSKEQLEEGSDLQLQFEKRGGLLPVIVQDAASLQILMLGYANMEAFKKSLHLGKATFWSTSREKLWTKGETSGDYLEIVEIRVDCDQDAILYLVMPQGEGACHTKNAAGESRVSCFYRYVDEQNSLQGVPGVA
ncbi:MAG: phosphoribosyl-AMP cyclohydrolase [Bacteroidota bacterium]